MVAKTETRVEAEAVMKATARVLIRYLKRKEHELNLPTQWTSVVTMKNTRGSWGGHDGVTISARYAMEPGQAAYVFKDYDLWNDDPVIGGFASTDRWAPLRAIVAHELAHAVQYEVARRARRRHIGTPAWHQSKDWTTAHGDGWKLLYAKMRAQQRLTRKLMLEDGILTPQAEAAA